jgi:TetR/AcrR family transcriptional regulator
MPQFDRDRKAMSARKENSRSRRRTRDRAVTSGTILDVAERMFAQRGLRAVRAEDIAAESGVTKAMIYYYFGTKENLYQAVLDRVFRERVVGMDLKSLERMPPGIALRTFTERLLAQMCRKPHLGPLFALENAQNAGAYYARSGGDVYRVLTNIVVRGVEDGSFRKLDPRHAAINIMGACVHYFNVSANVSMLWPRGHDRTPKLMRDHAELAVEFVMKAVLAPGLKTSVAPYVEAKRTAPERDAAASRRRYAAP